MRTTDKMFVALLIACLPYTTVVSAQRVQAQGEPGEPVLKVLGTYATGVWDEGAAEIVAFDPETRRAFSVNGHAKTIDVLDLRDPGVPTLIGQIDITEYGGGANSVDVHDGVVAVAVEADDKTENGSIAFFDTDGTFVNRVGAGALPDMITFTPDGDAVVVANEGEPNDDYSVDPVGSITIVDLSEGVENVTQKDVRTADFADYTIEQIDPAIRIFGPNASVAQDLEPEYIAVTPDGTMAYVTLQENNALAIVDLEAGEVVALVPLGAKNYNAPVATLTTYEWSDRPILGTTTAGQAIYLGGFSGLLFEGIDEATGTWVFVTHTDRGPNAEPLDVDKDGIAERPFPLPDFQPQLVRFSLDPKSGEIAIMERIGLARADGTPLTGLPNLAGDAGMAYADEEPIDLFGNVLNLDPLGGDFEGIVQVEDGTYWMADEYRPAIYHFAQDGRLIARYVPEGSAQADREITVGEEELPPIFAQRRANRGFEAVAYRDGTLYAFIQSPIDDPDRPDDASSKASTLVRILAFDIALGQTVGQYLYRLDGGPVDKIGDAVALADGSFLVLERDSARGQGARKLIYKVDLAEATNILGLELPTGLELQDAAGLAALGIRPAHKQLFVNLGALGYTAGDKPEGLALIDENTLAVINDDDFGLSGGFDPTTGLLDANPDAAPVVLGIVRLMANGLDASDRDGGINIRNWPVWGLYMPDAIAAYVAADGETYLVTANEGDARDYAGYSEEVRIADVVLDAAAFPDAAMLQRPQNLGRMRITTASGDTDGDGLFEQLVGYGARSFSIWDTVGNLVYDSGDQLEQHIAELVPEAFNSQGTSDSYDERSDDKGPEPEAVAIGEIDGRIFAFVGLERVGGIMVFDVTEPRSPAFVAYANNADATGAAEDAGDVAPEGLHFVAAEESPIGVPLLLVASEVSGTVTVWAVNLPTE